jgi:hypothetical protein
MPGLNAAHFFIRCGAILVCLVLGAVSTLAQTGSISGKITDSVGYVVVGAEIKALISSSDRAATSRAFWAISNNKGEFTIPSLPFGSYEVEVKAPGFKTLKKMVIVDGSQPIGIDLQVTPPKVCEDAKGPNIELAEKDKAEIINQVLKMEVQNLQSDGKPILLSNQNINVDWVSAPPGHTVTVLPILEIFMKARPGEFLSYSYFSEFEIHGDCVAITLIQSGVTSEGEKCNLCGGGATYVFRKEAGDWKGKFFSGWIS